MRMLFRVIERARGRVEAQALESHQSIPPHTPTAVEQQLTNLNLQLLNSDDPRTREHILSTIYCRRR
jgi:hypothetical protein